MTDNISPAGKTHEAFWSADLFEKGIGWVVIARFRSRGQRIETGVFLLNVWCLGVKRAVYDDLWTPDTYKTHIVDHYFEEFPMEFIEPCCGRKLVEDTARYGGSLGFAPHSDFKKGCRVFGGIRAEECAKNYIFGKDGKPFYVSGPNETEEQSRRIVEQLGRCCGPGNFEYMMAFD